MQRPYSELDRYVYCPICKADLLLKTIDGEEVKKCETCGFVFWNKPKPVVSIILHKDGKVLMLQRSNGPFKDYWVLPGGFLTIDETAEQAVKREAKEEVGLAIIIEDVVGTYLIEDDPRGVHLDIIFSGKTQGEIQLSKEDKKWEYFSVDSLPEQIAYKHRLAINDWKTKQQK